MKVAVISTLERCGATAATLLIGCALARTQGRSVRLCYTGENQSIKRYIGKDANAHDATRTISQVSKLLEAHAIGPEAIGDYCVSVSQDVDILDSWDDALTEEELCNLLTYTFSHNTTDYVLCDLDRRIDTPVAQDVLKACDVAIIVSEPSTISLEEVRALQSSEFWPKGKPTMLLISKYREEIGAIDTLAKVAQYKPRETCRLHYNPYITRCCNRGELLQALATILEKDPRTIELNADLKGCIRFLLGVQGQKLKWEG